MKQFTSEGNLKFTIFVITFLIAYVSYIILTARTPVFSHASITLDGLTSIRAMKAVPKFQATFNRLQDENMAVFFMVKCLQRWFALSGDVIGTLLVCIPPFMPLVLGRGKLITLLSVPMLCS